MPTDPQARAALIARDVQQAEHEIRTVALVEWGIAGSRRDALIRWAGVLREAADALAPVMPPQDEYALSYLSNLLRHYAPQCEPLADLSGVCSQIDNLLVGMAELSAPVVPEPPPDKEAPMRKWAQSYVWGRADHECGGLEPGVCRECDADAKQLGESVLTFMSASSPSVGRPAPEERRMFDVGFQAGINSVDQFGEQHTSADDAWADLVARPATHGEKEP